MIKVIESQPAASMKLGQLKNADVFRFTDCKSGLFMVCGMPDRDWLRTYVGLETGIVGGLEDWRADRPIALATTAELHVVFSRAALPKETT